MDKVKIQVIAEEAGCSNADIVKKANELGFNVKMANSSVSVKQAGILVEYAMSGTLPKDFKKPIKRSKIKVVKKIRKVEIPKKVEIEPKVEPPKKEVIKVIEKKIPIKIKTSSIQKVPKRTLEEKEASLAPIRKIEIREKLKEETQSSNVLIDRGEIKAHIIEEEIKVAPKKRKGITASVRKKVEIKTVNTNNKDSVEEKLDEDKPKRIVRKGLSRGGITIVRKAKPSSIKKKIKMSEPRLSMPKKKKIKKIAEAKESGEKLEIMGNRDFGGSDEVYNDAEVVLLDFSDKNIYEDMKRQDERRKAENKKRGQQLNTFRSRQNRSIRRGGKKKKYTRIDENLEKITVVQIPENVRVYEFAEKVGKSVGEVVKVLFTLGTMVTKNDFLDKDDIEILSEEFEVEVTTINPLDLLNYVENYDNMEDENSEERPPVLTIMGHVDHGKTSLLDKIRETKVVDKESGGITQHVGAYQVEKNGKKITFVDTPGHAAFTEMRARGAQSTDIVIIVVAADDGVKPQTKEAISHAKAGSVPIIVAINKMDKESANPEMVKGQLAELGILSVDWGGDIEFVNVSAHTGDGLDELLDVILIQSEVMELKADKSREGKAIVVESSLEKGFGPVANVIIQNGTLKVGDNVIVGNTYGRVKAMRNDHGKTMKEIGPSTPAAIVGLNEVPSAGDIMLVMNNEKEAKELASKRAEYTRSKELSKTTKATLDDLHSLIAEGQLKTLPVIIKADVHGSLEAIKASLLDLKNKEVKVNIIHEGIGGVTESDVTLCSASENAIILGFHVRPTGAVKKKAKELGVDVKTYQIIYDLLDDVKALLGGLMSPLVSEEMIGQAEVRETFAVAKVGTIAGSKVIDGSISRGSSARLIRDGVVIYQSNISSLKRFSEDAKEVKNGYECGIMLDKYNDIKAGDIIETFKNVEEQVTL
ncbi:MAG: translation initiation factor IF-2 [Sulfurovum sp.]|nr:translation initiation factor IF-2 [Sulfurovaceae bacterium]